MDECWCDTSLSNASEADDGDEQCPLDFMK